MRIEVTKDWCVRMAELEADEEIGVGLVAVDPVFDGESASAQSEEPAVAFGRFVSLMRRDRGLSVEKLADEADVDVVELLSIEEVTRVQAGSSNGLSIGELFRPSESDVAAGGWFDPSQRQPNHRGVRQICGTFRAGRGSHR